MILDELNVCQHLKIPSIPKKEWDGEKHFNIGVGVAVLVNGQDAYVVVTYKEHQQKPQVVKNFSGVPFVKIKKIFVVPTYLEDVDYENADLDNESKEKMRLLEEEAKELENKGVEEEIKLPKNEYFFKNIKNDDEAKAYIRAYNKRHKLNARVPKDHQGLIMRLSVIWMEETQNK